MYLLMASSLGTIGAHECERGVAHPPPWLFATQHLFFSSVQVLVLGGGLSTLAADDSASANARRRHLVRGTSYVSLRPGPVRRHEG